MTRCQACVLDDIILMLPAIDESRAKFEDAARDKLVLATRKGEQLRPGTRQKVFEYLNGCATRFKRKAPERLDKFVELIADYKIALDTELHACPLERECRYRRKSDGSPWAGGAPGRSPARDGSTARATGGGGVPPQEAYDQPRGESELVVEGEVEVESVQSMRHPGVTRHKAMGTFRLRRLGGVVLLGGVTCFGLYEYTMVRPPSPPLSSHLPTKCASPWVILDTTFKRNGPAFQWPVARQFFAVFGNFSVVEGEPGVEEVQLAPYEYFADESKSAGAYALVARCYDQNTCAKLTDKYVEVVGSPVKLSCGKPNVLGDAPVGKFAWSANRQENLPAADDYTALCARLNACEFAEYRSVPGNPFRECQRDHTKFKTHCATMDSCKKVIGCVRADEEAKPR
jgi:hypothetical protein